MKTKQAKKGEVIIGVIISHHPAIKIKNKTIQPIRLQTKVMVNSNSLDFL